MEISRLSSKGQVTIPKSIRELLNLSEGDRVVFVVEQGKVVVTKASLIALQELQQALSQDLATRGETEKDVMKELSVVREELSGERYKT
jgi:antitoxin PrlF